MNKGVMCTHEQNKLGLSVYYDERRVLEDDIQTEPIECHMEVKKWDQELWEMPWGRRQLGVGRHDKKIPANKATLGAVLQIIQNRFIWGWWWFFRCRTVSDRMWGSFPSALKFTRLVEIANNCREGDPLFRPANKSDARSRRLGINGLFFNGLTRLLAGQPSDFTVQSGTTSGSRTTHSEDLWLTDSLIWTAYWCLNRRAARMWFNLSTITWSRWITTRPPRMFDECFSISLVTTPTNSRPGSTCKNCGHFKGQRL